jgi:thiol-disulfide isomerase/thioredoxin
MAMEQEQETDAAQTMPTANAVTPSKPAKNEEEDPLELLRQQQRRNVAAAVLSIALAVTNYLWQFTHPISPVQLLATLQQTSDPLTVIGTNQKPSVVDFWAPWCENCKLFAPTLQKVEQEYRGEVNFCMVNGDDQPKASPYLDAFGVDAIPHLALVSADGTVETALIGPIPMSVLQADLNTLIKNAQVPKQDEKEPLPYTMLDVFAHRPAEQRKVHFDK